MTFRHPQVLEALRGVATLRIDATTGVAPEAEEFLKRYDVYGAPTVLLFDRAGQEQQALRVLGFVKPEEFLRRVARLQ